MVVPALDQLTEEGLTVVITERRENTLLDVGFETFFITFVQFFGVVIGGFLSAHVVDHGICVDMERGGKG